MSPAADGPDRSSTGLDENLAGALAYALGAITGAIFLLVERENRFVRFHALQSTITFLGVMVLQILIANTPILAGVISWLFLLAVAALWIALMVKALRGERFKLPYVGDWAERELR